MRIAARQKGTEMSDIGKCGPDKQFAASGAGNSGSARHNLGNAG
jgi:hypothetical protein